MCACLRDKGQGVEDGNGAWVSPTEVAHGEKIIRITAYNKLSDTSKK